MRVAVLGLTHDYSARDAAPGDTKAGVVKEIRLLASRDGDHGTRDS